MSKQLSQQRFGQFAAGYITNVNHAKGAELARLIEIAQPQPNWQMLDIATGGGHTARTFAPHVAHVIASDLTPEMLEAARDHITNEGITNVSFELADAENLPFEAAQFDLVTCRIAPHHFPNVPQFLSECYRVLKPDGVLLIQDQVLSEDETIAAYTDAFEKHRDPSHNRAYPESAWVQMVKAAGFTIAHTERVIKRHEFHHWASMQGCTPETIKDLLHQMEHAPEGAFNWMQILDLNTDNPTFVNHHLIIKGRKP